MTEKEIKSIKSLIVEREEIAYKRLKGNIPYQDICERQDETEKIVEELYHDRFTKEERITIRRHYEGETEKDGMEINEVYIQGFKDCFKLVTYMGLLSDDI